MTKTEAIQDAKDRMERTGLTWLAIRIKSSVFSLPVYDTVGYHHKVAHASKYNSGRFRVIATFAPQTGTELDEAPIIDKAIKSTVLRNLMSKLIKN